MSSVQFPTPHAAEDAFYRAFAATDLDAMMAVWADDDTVSCVHPDGPRLDGRSAIRRSWQLIFEGTTGVRFVLANTRYMHDAELAVHLVHEHIQVQRAAGLQTAVIATNVYSLTKYGWRMVLHHASSGHTPQQPVQRPLH
ncbi:MAG: YybH family protein [Acidiferrobacterales bacterium]